MADAATVPVAAPVAPPAVPARMSTATEHMGDTENLSVLAAETSVSLDKIWVEVGLTEEERAQRMGQLQADVAALYRARVRAEDEEREALREQVGGLRAGIVDMAKSLVSETAMPDIPDGTALREQIRTLSARSEALAKEHSARTDKLTSLCTTLRSLCDELKVEIKEGFDAIGAELTDTREVAFDAEIAEVSSLKAARQKEARQLVEDIHGLWDEMSMSTHHLELAKCVAACDPDDSNAEGLEGLSLSQASLEAMGTMAKELTAEKLKREARVQELCADIEALWDRLKVSEEARVAWLDEHQGLGTAVIEACEEKLGALKEEMVAKLATIIGDARQTIRDMWDEMHYGADQRTFAGMDVAAKAFNDDVLAQHEAHIEELEGEAAKLRPMLKAIAKREAILGEREAYEAMVKDPSRLLSRGRVDAARRIREEKLERRIKKELPLLTQKLIDGLKVWNDEHERPFLYDGKDVLEELRSEAQEAVRAKQQAKKQKEADKLKARQAAANVYSDDPGTPIHGLSKAKSSARNARKLRMAASAIGVMRSPAGKRKAGSIQTDAEKAMARIAAKRAVSRTLPNPKRGGMDKAAMAKRAADDSAAGAADENTTPATEAVGAGSKGKLAAIAKKAGSKIPAPGGGAAKATRGTRAGLRGAVALMMSGVENED